MSPLRWDVLITGFLLAVPVLLLGLRGDLAADEVAVRLLWCLAAGWAAVALVRYASTPPRAAPVGRTPADAAPAEGEPPTA